MRLCRVRASEFRNIMEFTVHTKLVQDAATQTSPPAPRRGTLVLHRKDGRKCEIQTPGCFLYTQMGSLPQLTPDDLQYINNLSHPLPLQMDLASASIFADSAGKFGKSLGQYVGYPEAFVYLTLHDVMYPQKPFSNDKASVGLWNKSGKVKVTPDKFLDLCGKLKPDLVQIICDTETELVGASGQRTSKSCESSLRWLDHCLDKMGQTASKIPVLASVGGGSNPIQRAKFCSEVSGRKVDGFIMDGFGSTWLSSYEKWGNEPDIFGGLGPMIHRSMIHLPEDKPRFLHAPLSPNAVIQLVTMGIDVFDTSYPAALAHRGQALVRIGDYEMKVLSLSEAQYFEDLTSLSTICGCYTCSKYTKAYIHHLIRCMEINAGVLLMIHNLNEYLKFFKDLRHDIENGLLDSWTFSPDAAVSTEKSART